MAAAYDEDADGFQFARKTRSKKAQAEPQPIPERPASSKAPTTTRPKPKKDSIIGSTPPREEPAQRRRRSARLSGDKEQVATSAPSEKPKRKRKSDEVKQSGPDREISPQLVGGGLSVAKKRDGTKIALPFADTPVIRRNKEMRKENKSKHRRSSTGLRGRRASSLIDSGTSNGGVLFRTYSSKRVSKSASKSSRFTSLLSDEELTPLPKGEKERHANIVNITAVPHAEVDSGDFYKHIEQSLPEPRRMKQLLTWNGTRMLPEKVNGGAGDASETFAVDGARHMMEELLKDWANKSEMSDWFNREDAVSSTAIVKIPNPHNARMAAKAQMLEDEVKRLQDEKKSWEFLRSSNSATAERCPSKAMSEIDAALLDPTQTSILTTLQSTNKPDSDTGTSDVTARLQKIVLNLEPQIDLFADGIHRISQYRIAAERVADRILGATAAQLETRDRDARAVSGTAGVGARDVLSALGGALSEQRR